MFYFKIIALFCFFGINSTSYRDDKFLVQMSDTYRLVFQQNDKGEFMEYGERLSNSVWVKTFEDVFEK